MPYLTTRDAISLHYDDAGAGRPLLFVHGWSFSSRIWARQTECFARNYRCIAPDLRGHGRSMPSRSGYGIDVLSSDVASFFDMLSLTDVTLAGWSLGVLAALAAYPTVQERVSAMVLVAGTAKYCSSEDYPYGLPPKEPRSLSVLLKRNPHKAMDGFRRSMFSDEEDAAEQGAVASGQGVLPCSPLPSPEILDLVLDTLVSADVRPVLPTVRVPTLIVHGDSDRICPADASRYIASRIPGAELVVIPGAGHAPMLSRANEFNAVLGTFLERVHA